MQEVELQGEQVLELLDQIRSDFKSFCSLIEISARDYSVPPSEAIDLIPQPFALKQHQLELFDRIDSLKNNELVILKCRQIGITELLVAYILWRLLFYTNERILFVTPGADRVQEARRKFSAQYRAVTAVLGDVLGAPLKITGTGGYGAEIRNSTLDSRLDVLTATERTGRSGTYTLAVLDEFAFCEPNTQPEVLAAVRPASAKRIIISTPNRESDTFHELCNLAESDKSLFKKTIHDVKDDWFGNPDNAALWLSDELFYKKKQSEINKEYLCEFRGAVEQTVWIHCKDWFRAPPSLDGGSHCFAMDIGWIDQTAILFGVCFNSKLYIYDELIATEKRIRWIAEELKEKRPGYHWGCMDSQAKKVDITSGISPHTQLAQLMGCRIHTHKLPDKIKMLNIGQSALDTGEVFISPNCEKLTEMIYNYERLPNGNLPHNEYSHIHDSLVYLILNWQIHGKHNGSQRIRARPRSHYGIY